MFASLGLHRNGFDYSGAVHLDARADVTATRPAVPVRPASKTMTPGQSHSVGCTSAGYQVKELSRYLELATDSETQPDRCPVSATANDVAVAGVMACPSSRCCCPTRRSGTSGL
jgi:hypothetical protein